MADVTMSIPALPLRTPLHTIDLSSDDQGSSTGPDTGPDASLLVLEDGDKSEQGDSWETESFFEDAFENLENEPELEDGTLDLEVNAQFQRVPGDACSLDESLGYRSRLRFLGEEAFINETIEAGTISAKKLCTAFGIRPPSFLEGAPDHAYYQLLSLGVQRELAKRAKLPQYNTVDDVVTLLKKSKRIVVVSGAGISTSLGIPDFRSKNTGLYSQLQHIGLNDPQEVFDLSLFRENPEIFYSIAKNILPLSNQFSPTHAFIRLLQDKQKLLTNFTQNIDNLEHYAGIHADKLIQCHGSFATASCIECKNQVKGEEIYKCLKAGMVAPCNQCISRVRQNSEIGTKRKRILSIKPNKKRRRDYEDELESEDDSIAVAGVMKPDITFFGEPLPARFHSRLEDHDYEVVDLVLVIGTSLKVAPVSDIPGFLPPHVPQVYISREPCAHINFDITLLGDCDTIVAELCRQTGWDLDHEMVSKDQRSEINVLDDNKSYHVFKTITKRC